MSLMLMMLAASRSAAYVPTTYTQTFSSNATFAVPAGVTSLDTVSGQGADGSPGTQSTTQTGWQRTQVVYYQRRDGGFESSSYPPSAPVFDGSPKPADYCDPVQYYCNPDTDAGCTIGSTIYSSSQSCYQFATVTQTTPGTPSTSGASASGFGKVFPGGDGGPASTETYPNVPVTGGGSYSVVVPSGASITITYKA